MKRTPKRHAAPIFSVRLGDGHGVISQAMRIAYLIHDKRDGLRTDVTYVGRGANGSFQFTIRRSK